MYALYRACRGQENFHRHVALTGLGVRPDHVCRQGLTVQARGHHLEITNERPKVAVVGACQRIDGAVLEGDVFFPQHTACNPAQRFVAGTDKIDFQEVSTKPVASGSP